jgi:hypothetical protein
MKGYEASLPSGILIGVKDGADWEEIGFNGVK